jgi:hypothetical protein
MEENFNKMRKFNPGEFDDMIISNFKNIEEYIQKYWKEQHVFDGLFIDFELFTIEIIVPLANYDYTNTSQKIFITTPMPYADNLISVNRGFSFTL